MEGHVPRTLIVDDEEDMRLLMRSTIEAANEGLTVAGEARNGFEAVEQWREAQPDILVLQPTATIDALPLNGLIIGIADMRTDASGGLPTVATSGQTLKLTSGVRS